MKYYFHAINIFTILHKLHVSHLCKGYRKVTGREIGHGSTKYDVFT